jgi:ubiquinone biosynthesis protein UbiJ
MKTVLNHVVDRAFAQYLALDEKAPLYLAPLAGKVIALIIKPFNHTIYLAPTKTSVACLVNFDGLVDTTITGSIIAFSKMGWSKTPMRALFSGEVKITGDTNTGRKFQQLFDHLDINLEKELAYYTGDSIATQLTHLFRTSGNWCEATQESFQLNLSEFLQEESRDLPTQAEVDIFYANIDQLRMNFDCFDARIKRLHSLIF